MHSHAPLDALRCRFTPVDEPPAADGKRRCACADCGRLTAPTASPPERIFARCPAKPRGLGDVVAAAAEWIGMRRPCRGCKRRRRLLNQLWPF